MRIGTVPLARPTFDVPFAEEVAAAAYATLDRLDAEIVGRRDLLFDADSTAAALADLAGEQLDLVLVMQVTFTDASMAQLVAAELSAPITLWAFPEQRTGGRLRLNSFCGINLAAHALAKEGRSFSWLYSPPSEFSLDAPRAEPAPGFAPPPPGGEAAARAGAVADRIRHSRVGVIGPHPDGFVPCEYDADELASVTGVAVDRFELDDLFDRARSAPAAAAEPARSRTAGLAGIGDVDQEELGRSLGLYPALRSIAAEHELSGLAVRCWPECFTEYGAANCGPAALLNDEMLPTACEADVYGNVTAVALQWLADGPVLVADLVDIDLDGDTGVLWHCGKAPLSMADPESRPAATIHTNRSMPLLMEFPLKPGRVTIARLSQSRGEHRLVVGGGEMLRAPLAFSGTAGVIRFDRPTADVAATIMGEGLEHHYGIVYGDVRAELYALAGLWGIPVVDL